MIQLSANPNGRPNAPPSSNETGFSSMLVSDLLRHVTPDQLKNLGQLLLKSIRERAQVAAAGN